MVLGRGFGGPMVLGRAAGPPSVYQWMVRGFGWAAGPHLVLLGATGVPDRFEEDRTGS